MIQDRDDIHHGDGPGIRGPVVRFITRAMPTGIDQDEPIVALQRLNIPPLVPIRQITIKAVQEHKRGAFPSHVVMNTDALVGGVWHARPPYILR
jgi:hypothetical protein